jgi:hypothetical protein
MNAIVKPAPGRMTDKAGGVTYEQFVAKGWTDAQLREHGYMVDGPALPQTSATQPTLSDLKLALDTAEAAKKLAALSNDPERQASTHDEWLRAHRAYYNMLSGTSTSDEWPEPTNFLDDFEAPPFDGTELPPQLAEYPVLYSRRTGHDLTIAMHAAPVAAAAVIDDRIQVCADSATKWFTQARLWGLVIGVPAAGKTPVQQKAILGPVRELHSKFYSEWRAQVDALPENAPKHEKPAQPRIVVDNVTIEAMSTVLEHNTRGVIVASDEFDSWFGSLNQYKGGKISSDAGEWRAAFEGGPRQIERVQRGTIFVPNWGVSILMATTPEMLQKLSPDLPNDGLLQRFLVALARRQNLTPDNPPDDRTVDAARERYAALINALWSLTPRLHNGVVYLSPEAREAFEIWRQKNQLEQEAFGSIDKHLESHIAKYSTLALRLALVFHCVRVVCLPSGQPWGSDPAAYSISVEDMQRAFAFLRVSARHAMAMYFSRQGSKAMAIAKDIARLIISMSAAEHANGVQRRDLLRRVHSFNAAGDEALQDAALRLLSDFGWLRASEGGYRKERPTRFAINPGIATKFAALAERERARRAVMRELIGESATLRRAENELSRKSQE